MNNNNNHYYRLARPSWARLLAKCQLNATGTMIELESTRAKRLGSTK